MALRFTPAARRDLDSIWDTTVDRWGTGQAVKYLTALKDRCIALTGDPRLSRSADHLAPSLCRTLSGRHVIYHRRTENEVIVIRILHQRMDPDLHL